jgi:RNase P subunit RPR2
MSSLLAAQTTAATVKRYCDTCNQSVEPKIQPTKQSNYHGDDVAAVTCRRCGTQLGHLTYWPSQADQ